MRHGNSSFAGKIVVGGLTPANSSVIDINSTTSGVLPPRMNSSQRTTISSPAEGLFVYDNFSKTLWYYNGTSWIEIDSSTFIIPSIAQSFERFIYNETNNATPTELFVDGINGERLELGDQPRKKTWAFQITISARRVNGDNESAAYEFRGAIDNQGTESSTALVNGVSETVLAEDTSAWSVAVTADTTLGALIVTVTGEAAKQIRWAGRVVITEVRDSGGG